MGWAVSRARCHRRVPRGTRPGASAEPRAASDNGLPSTAPGARSAPPDSGRPLRNRLRGAVGPSPGTGPESRPRPRAILPAVLAFEDRSGRDIATPSARAGRPSRPALLTACQGTPELSRACKERPFGNRGKRITHHGRQGRGPAQRCTSQAPQRARRGAGDKSAEPSTAGPGAPAAARAQRRVKALGGGPAPAVPWYQRTSATSPGTAWTSRPSCNRNGGRPPH